MFMTKLEMCDFMDGIRTQKSSISKLRNVHIYEYINKYYFNNEMDSCGKTKLKQGGA